MALVVYVECDGCGAAHKAESIPASWPTYTRSDGGEPLRFCTDLCASALLGNTSQYASRLQRLGVVAGDVELLRLIALGLTSKEIAVRAKMTPRTVKNRLSRLNSALGTQDRIQAVVIGHALALINVNVLAPQLLAALRAPRPR